MELHFRKAEPSDHSTIWEIIQGAIARRKADGSRQWQDGYPNPIVISDDIEREIGFVLCTAYEIVGYAALLINDEPAYDVIEGNWLSNGDFIVYHRVAISQKHIGQGLAKQLLIHIEKYTLEQGIHSLKVDTNFDNGAMLHLMDTMGYTYCGEVYFRGSARRAYEKLLNE